MRIAELITEDWEKVNRKDKTSGMSKKAVKAYRRENPGSKLQTAVTTKPSKLKKAARLPSVEELLRTYVGHEESRASAKTKRDPNSNINKALRRWNCESIIDMRELILLAEHTLRELKRRQ